MASVTASSPGTGLLPGDGETSGTLRSHTRPGSNSLSGPAHSGLTSSAGASPARTSPSPVAVQGCLALALDCSLSSSAWLESYAQRGFCWKTSLASSAATGAGTSPSSSLPWETQGTAWGGECWTRGGSESPSGAAGCSLSDILEVHVPPRFSLSPKACRGILHRAGERGTKLPTRLRRALEAIRLGPDGTARTPSSRRRGAPSAD